MDTAGVYRHRDSSLAAAWCWAWRASRSPPAATACSATRAPTQNSWTTWILITPDNLVTVLVPHCEMGQGSQTALAMMAAEELNADWNSCA